MMGFESVNKMRTGSNLRVRWKPEAYRERNRTSGSEVRRRTSEFGRGINVVGTQKIIIHSVGNE